MVSTWLFVPNIIGYVRILTGAAAFYYAPDASQWSAAFWLYAVSYSLDALDGVAARALGQTSQFGAVLDMVTDRFCTAGLLAVLAALYPASAHLFLWLMMLDIVSHWAQMYRCARPLIRCLANAAHLCTAGWLPLPFPSPVPSPRILRPLLRPLLLLLQLDGGGRGLAQEHGGRAPAAALLLHIPLRALYRLHAQRDVPGRLLPAQARERRRGGPVRARRSSTPQGKRALRRMARGAWHNACMHAW